MKKTVVVITLVLALIPLAVHAQAGLQEQTEAFAGEQGAGFVGEGERPQDPHVAPLLVVDVADHVAQRQPGQVPLEAPGTEDPPLILRRQVGEAIGARDQRHAPVGDRRGAPGLGGGF